LKRRKNEGCVNEDHNKACTSGHVLFPVLSSSINDHFLAPITHLPATPPNPNFFGSDEDSQCHHWSVGDMSCFCFQECLGVSDTEISLEAWVLDSVS